MSHASPVEPPVPTDGELIALVHGGDSEAYGELFARHHTPALRLARQLAGPADADDLVSEAFTKVYHVLRRGGGPEIAFRAYLLTAVRRLHVDRIRAARMVVPTDDIADFEGIPFDDPAIAGFDNAAAASAFRSLPERWQVVLWHLEVEAQRPAEVAPLLGMTANGVSALGYRAREGLRQAYLQMHLNASDDEDCRWVTERLGARVRNGLCRRDQRKVDDHLDSCRRCSAVLLELTDINSSLGAVLAPLVLGTAATGYVTAAATGGTAGLHGVWALMTASRHVVNAHGVLTAGGAAASVVAVAAGAALLVAHLPADPAAASMPRLRGEVYVAHPSSTSPQHGRAHQGSTHATPPALRPSTHGRLPTPFVGRQQPKQPSGIPPTLAPPTLQPPLQPPQTPPSTRPTRTRHTGPPTTPPQTTPPGQVDASMSRSSAEAQPHSGQLEAHMRVDTSPAARVELTMTIVLPPMSRLQIAAGPWQCDPWPPTPQVTQYTCTITAAHPPVVNVSFQTVDHASPWITAHATATGVVDKNPDNNTFVWQP